MRNNTHAMGASTSNDTTTCGEQLSTEGLRGVTCERCALVGDLRDTPRRLWGSLAAHLPSRNMRMTLAEMSNHTHPQRATAACAVASSPASSENLASEAFMATQARTATKGLGVNHGSLPGERCA